MTLEQVKALSDEELRVKVAELCGWKRITPENHCLKWPSRNYVTGFDGWMMKAPDGSTLGRLPPDYPRDLNAMYSAERWMAENTAYSAIYTGRLIEMVCDCFEETPQTMDKLTVFFVVTATARQRAEAFVLTLDGAAGT